ncbi:MAG: DUF4296 domain-containing protein [Bacteroidetes bacterium]|nr:DUF4296 domain-containing protein [Bacteroidota bacterium]
MHRYKILFFSLLVFLCSCGGKTIPDNVIQPDKMVRVLTEVHIADGAMYNVMQLPDSLYKYGTDRYLKIFKQFHTDSVQFRRSMKYYCNNPGMLADMYDQVTDILKQKSDSLNKVNQAEMAVESKRRADSLKRLPRQVPPQPQHAQPVTPAPQEKVKFNNRRYIPAPQKRNANPIK